MNKDQTENMWIELKEIHEKLVRLNFNATGTHAQAPIKRAERAIVKAIQILKPSTELEK